MAGVEGASGRSKLTKVMDGSGNISTMGVDFLAEVPQVNRFPVNHYCGAPLIAPLVPIHAFKSAAATYLLCSIRTISGVCTRSDIFPSVIKAIPIFMVVLLASFHGGFIHNLSMHVDITTFLSRESTSSIPLESVGLFHFRGEPFETGDEVKIARGNSSEFPLRQCNPSSTFFHSSSSTGRCCFADSPACLSKFNQN